MRKMEIDSEENELELLEKEFFGQRKTDILNEGELGLEREVDELKKLEFEPESFRRRENILFFRKIGTIPLLSPEKMRELIIQGKKGDQSARNNVIQANLRLVISIALRYRYKGLDLIDLIDEGVLGLIKAFGKFEVTKGISFPTYATWWIRAFITRALADTSRVIRRPVYFVDEMMQLEKVRREFTKVKHRSPTVKELSEIILIPEDELGKKIALSQRILSLDANYGDEEDCRLSDVIPDKNAINPEEEAHVQKLKRIMAKMISTLSTREEMIIRMRFGIGRIKKQKRQKRCNKERRDMEYTLAEIGRTKEFNLSRERVRQIEEKALSKLKLRAEKLNLADFLDE